MNHSFPNFNKRTIENVEKKFERTNGNRLDDFTIKQVLLLISEDLKKDITEINQRIDKHLEWSNKFMRDHDKCIVEVTEHLKHITSELPEKGFCEKIEKTLYTKNGIDKVEILWNDRRWVRGIIYALLALGGANLTVTIIGAI